MTAVLTDSLVELLDTDADLVRGSVAGDRTAFAQIYDRYADRLYDFCVGMLRDRDAAADCVQEAFCIAATRLQQLRDPEKLRPWLYVIARNESLARIRERRRETLFDEFPEIESQDATPDDMVARTELAELLATAADGLSERDRVVFDLAFRHGLSGPDLADALEISHNNANKIVLRLRRTIERSLGALMLSRRAGSSRGGCPELGGILAGWDGQLTVLMRKRVARHIESCAPCGDEQRRLVNPAALLGATPIFIPAPGWLRETTLSEIELICHGSAMEGETDDSGALFAVDADSEAVSSTSARARRSHRRWLWAVVLLIAVLGASVGMTFAWSNRGPVTNIPTEVSGTAPEPHGHTSNSGTLSQPLNTLHTPTIVPTPPPTPQPPQEPGIYIPTVPQPPQGLTVHTPIETSLPQGLTVHTPIETSLPQARVAHTPLPITPQLNPQPAGLPSVDTRTSSSERKPDLRRLNATARDSGSATGNSPSLQRSSSSSVAPPSSSRTAVRPAAAPDSAPETNSDSDATPKSPTARQTARGASAPPADPPGRRGTRP